MGLEQFAGAANTPERDGLAATPDDPAALFG